MSHNPTDGRHQETTGDETLHPVWKFVADGDVASAVAASMIAARPDDPGNQGMSQNQNGFGARCERTKEERYAICTGGQSSGHTQIYVVR